MNEMKYTTQTRNEHSANTLGPGVIVTKGESNALGWKLVTSNPSALLPT